DGLPKLEFVIVFEPEGDIGDAIPLHDLRERGRAHDDAEYERRVESVGRDDVCLYIYTSGTTGPPKGCILTHGNYRDVVNMTIEQGTLSGEEVPAQLMEPFEQADGALYQKVRDLFGGRIRHAVTGAAPIAQEILEFFYACGVPVLEGYGMTETSTVATVNTVEDFRFGSVG